MEGKIEAKKRGRRRKRRLKKKREAAWERDLEGGGGSKRLKGEA